MTGLLWKKKQFLEAFFTDELSQAPLHLYLYHFLFRKLCVRMSHVKYGTTPHRSAQFPTAFAQVLLGRAWNHAQINFFLCYCCGDDNTINKSTHTHSVAHWFFLPEWLSSVGQFPSPIVLLYVWSVSVFVRRPSLKFPTVSLLSSFLVLSFSSRPHYRLDFCFLFVNPWFPGHHPGSFGLLSRLVPFLNPENQ